MAGPHQLGSNQPGPDQLGSNQPSPDQPSPDQPRPSLDRRRLAGHDQPRSSLGRRRLAGHDSGRHDLSGAGSLAEVHEAAGRALTQYPLSPSARLSLLHVSENATFRIDDPDAPDADRAVSVLRMHRLGYHAPGAIESELAWMAALRRDAEVRTPRVLPAADGRTVVQAPDPATGAPRSFVRFEFLPGHRPTGADRHDFVELGALTARLHHHARTWQPPAGFTRFCWRPDQVFGPDHRWGRWQDAPGVGTEERRVLSRLEVTIRRRLARFGTAAARFGLVHADTRLANLLVAGDQLGIIDFDDCGYSWYLYDLATAFSFFEDAPYVPDLIDAWLEGYRDSAELAAEDEQEIWTFILFRRLLLVAWFASHPAAEDARRLGASYTTASAALAESYLSRLG